MPEIRVDAVLFDMDGVVIDSGDVYARHWRSWGAQHGLDYDVHIRHVHGGRPPVETIRVVAPDLDAVAEAARFNASLEASPDADTAAAMPGARELLHALPPDRWTIATSAVRSMASAWLQHAGLPVPRSLVGFEDVERGKPAPDPYLRAAELLGVEPTRCLVVEDAPAGVTAARAAGATVLAVLTTHALEVLTEADAVTAGLHMIEAETDGDGLLIRWRDPGDRAGEG